MKRFTSSAVSAVGGLALLVVPAVARAQAAAAAPAPRVVAAAASGSVRGLVHDEEGAPVAGAMVSAVGPITAFAVTGDGGRFELRALPPGPYLLRVHLRGYDAPRGQRLEVNGETRVSSSIAVRRAPPRSDGARPVAAASVAGASDAADSVIDRLEASLEADAEPTATETAAADAVPPEESELTWRLRHLRRSILKDTVTVAVVAEGGDREDAGFFGRAISSPMRLAGDFFAVPLSGQVNLLTTSTFDDPSSLFEGDSRARGITYVSLGSPAGAHADWTVRGALTDGDLTSWIVAGSYLTRADAPGRHRYDVRLSYSTERYDGGNPEALRAVADGSRNVGVVSGFDTVQLADSLAVTYGGRYSHYDYLEARSLLSPSVRATFTPADRFRITTMLSRRAVAPGAEEFMPPVDSAVWLPPQRTFSPATPGGRFTAERTTHLDVGVERDFPGATITARAYQQHVDDQLVTLFGADLPDRPAGAVGHYFVGGAGDVDVRGWAAGVRTEIADRVTGAVEYAVSTAEWRHGGEVDYLLLLAPSVRRPGGERVHDVNTRIETELPETDTRVLVLYRLSDGFSRGDASADPAFDSRFDVQVRQSLPFMDFSAARWEMLIGVRNFFRDPAAGQSVYDELLVVNPPKRIVGGLTVRF